MKGMKNMIYMRNSNHHNTSQYHVFLVLVTRWPKITVSKFVMQALSNSLNDDGEALSVINILSSLTTCRKMSFIYFLVHVTLGVHPRSRATLYCTLPFFIIIITITNITSYINWFSLTTVESCGKANYSCIYNSMYNKPKTQPISNKIFISTARVHVYYLYQSHRHDTAMCVIYFINITKNRKLFKY